MIGKKEILDRAEITNLNPHIIEKDYALGWLLAGIFSNKNLAKNWIFKGGTCLKKCYFETYRFSEDLDFTLKDKDHLDLDFLKNIFSKISEWIYRKTNLEFPDNLQDFDIYETPQGRLNCQGKLSYQGPVSPRSGGLPRIKLDITADETVILPPVHKQIFHPYSDCPKRGIKVTSYAYEEVFAEKIRALSDRANPRDLYDVINLYRNTEAKPNISVLGDILKNKCEFKGIPVPKLSDVLKLKSDIKGSWQTMLGHQLPYLPSVDSFWKVLPDCFKWLTGKQPLETKMPCKLRTGESLVDEQTFKLSLSQKLKSYVELIRFAATNQLCVKFEYQNLNYQIEPYSLRKKQNSQFVLYGWNISKKELYAYYVDHIQDVEVTDHVFVPRYLVELIPKIQ